MQIDADGSKPTFGPLTDEERLVVWRELSAGTVTAARILLPLLALAYGVVIAERTWWKPDMESAVAPMVSASMMLGCWFVFLLVRRPGSWVQWLMFLPCCTVVGMELVEYHHAVDRSSNLYITLVLLGASLLLTAIPPMVICVSTGLAAWAVITLQTKHPSWFSTIYAHVPTVLVGVSVNLARRRLVIRLCRSRLREQHQREALQEAQNDLIESDRRFKQFADHSEQVFWINQWDPPAVLYVNPAYEVLTGRSIKSLKENPADWLNSVHEDEEPMVRRAYKNMLETGRFDEEYRIVRPDGTQRWVRDQGVPIYNSDGIADRVAGVVSDITERRKVEDALRASQTRLYNLVSSIDGIVWECQPDGMLFTYVSQAAESILGFPTYQWTNERGFWPSIIHADDRQRVLEYCKAQTDAGYDHEAEYRFIAADGREVWVHDRVRLVRDETGQVTHLRGVMFDITAAKVAEEKQLASEQRFRHLFEQSPDAVFVESLDGIVLDVNDEACRLHRMTRQQLIGKPVHELAPPEDAETVKREFPRVASGELTFFEGKSQPLDGEPVTVEIRAGRIDYEGQPALLLQVRDMSERIAAEQEKQLMAAQIRQMQKLEAVGTLASGVAHDFNNLLTAIQGFNDMARQQLAPEHPVQEHVEMIEHAAEQGAGVTRALLTFAQKLPTHKRTVDLGQITRDTVRLLHRLMPANIDLHDVCIDRPVWVNADPHQLQQVLMNLAINGRDAMPGGGELTITLEDIINPQGQSLAQLTVIDTGAGMTEDVIQRIFEPFFTTKEREQGTGLGLAIIHGIIKEHAGAIDVQSTPGEGSTFVVQLPCCDAPEPTYELWRDPQPSHEGQRILLAEDNEYVRAIMTSTLQGEGFHVVAVGAGDRLLAAFDKHRQHTAAIVLDLDLPKVDGETCLQTIRQTDPNVPVIIVTANAHRLLDSQHADSVALLSKPFPMSSLIDVINVQLAGDTSTGVK